MNTKNLLDKPLPHSYEAETALLGTLISYPESINEVIDTIKPEDFYNTKHVYVYAAIESLYTHNQDITLVAIIEHLKDIGKLEEVTITYLSTLSQVGNHIKQYADIVKEKSNKRKLIKIAYEVLESEENTNEIIGKTEDKMFKLLNNKESNLTKIDDALEDTLKNLERLNGGMTGLDTGFKEINRITGGLQKTDLVIVAGRPSMGKSVLGLNLAINISKKNSVAMFSLEMSKTQLMERALSSECHIDNDKVKTGNLSTEEWKTIAQKSGYIAQRKLYIDDTAGQTLNQIKAKCKRLKAQHGLDLVVIDYLQLMSGEGENRQQEISYISRGLKVLAKDLNICVVALSQLSRAPEQRTDHRPLLSDLRESGSIEQDADIIIFPYRDEYYHKDTEDKNVAEIIFGKNRNGKIGVVKLAFLGQYQMFGNLDYVYSGRY